MVIMIRNLVEKVIYKYFSSIEIIGQEKKVDKLLVGSIICRFGF